GTPQVRALVPAPGLIARMVTVKHADEEAAFIDAAGKKLGELDLKGRLELRRWGAGARQGQPRRQVVRIKDRKVVGYRLAVHDLDPADSVRLQEVGLGGRRRMGCGIFLPLREEQTP